MKNVAGDGRSTYYGVSTYQADPELVASLKKCKMGEMYHTPIEKTGRCDLIKYESWGSPSPLASVGVLDVISTRHWGNCILYLSNYYYLVLKADRQTIGWPSFQS